MTDTYESEEDSEESDNWSQILATNERFFNVFCERMCFAKGQGKKLSLLAKGCSIKRETRKISRNRA